MLKEDRKEGDTKTVMMAAKMVVACSLVRQANCESRKVRQSVLSHQCVPKALSSGNKGRGRLGCVLFFFFVGERKENFRLL